MTLNETLGNKTPVRRRGGRIDLPVTEYKCALNECLVAFPSKLVFAGKSSTKTRTNDRLNNAWETLAKCARYRPTHSTSTPEGAHTSNEQLNTRNGSLTRRPSQKTAGVQAPAGMCRPQTEVTEMKQQHPRRHKDRETQSTNKHVDYSDNFEPEHTTIEKTRTEAAA